VPGGSLNHPVHCTISANHIANQQNTHYAPVQQLFPTETNPDLPGFNMRPADPQPGRLGIARKASKA
jgi:hypothetical protein